MKESDVFDKLPMIQDEEDMNAGSLQGSEWAHATFQMHIELPEGYPEDYPGNPMPEDKLVPMPSAELVASSEVPVLLDRVRPHWQSKNLITRVRALLPVDPSSACQRILNAAIHDLREKVAVAGIDIAQQAAVAHRLPPVTRVEDLEEYSTARLLDLAYRIGLLSRPEWRRLCRCYEIRQDLEHEDDEYEAGIEDCIYIFKTCVEAVLSRDPITPLRINDVKELVNKPDPVTPAQPLLDDFAQAPHPRQEEIMRFLLSIALDPKQPEIVQQNAYNFLTHFKALTHSNVLLRLVDFFQERIGRMGLDRRHARVAMAAGVMPYLKQADRVALFESVYAQMDKVGEHWTGHQEHGELLRSFQEIGGLLLCPESVSKKIIKWLVLLYLGEPGGRTMFGNIRPVFYSNSGAPLAYNIIRETRSIIRKQILELAKDRDVRKLCADKHIAERWQKILDVMEAGDDT